MALTKPPDFGEVDTTTYHTLFTLSIPIAILLLYSLSQPGGNFNLAVLVAPIISVIETCLWRKEMGTQRNGFIYLVSFFSIRMCFLRIDINIVGAQAHETSSHNPYSF